MSEPTHTLVDVEVERLLLTRDPNRPTMVHIWANKKLVEVVVWSNVITDVTLEDEPAELTAAEEAVVHDLVDDLGAEYRAARRMLSTVPKGASGTWPMGMWIYLDLTARRIEARRQPFLTKEAA